MHEQLFSLCLSQEALDQIQDATAAGRMELSITCKARPAPKSFLVQYKCAPCACAEGTCNTFRCCIATHRNKLRLSHARTCPAHVPGLGFAAPKLSGILSLSVLTSRDPSKSQQDAGGTVLQEAAFSHACHLHSDEPFSQHLKDPSLHIIHDLEISSFTPPPTSSLHGSGQRHTQPRRCF